MNDAKRTPTLAEIREQHASDVERCKRGGFALTHAAKDIGQLLGHVDALVAKLERLVQDCDQSCETSLVHSDCDIEAARTALKAAKGEA